MDRIATAEPTPTGTERVTVDADIHAHMLGTYASLRLLIAVTTLAFLVTLLAYRGGLLGPDSTHRNSISAYYHHDNAGFRMKDAFVGSLVSVALLLVAYQGYTDRENWALNVGGFALLGVVAFPMDWDAGGNRPGDLTAAGAVHYACAVTFFLSLAYVGLFRAHDTLALLRDGPRKALYRGLYRITGGFMLVVPAVAILLYAAGDGGWVYAVEVFGVWVFLIYWVCKSSEVTASRVETRTGLRETAERAVGPSGGPKPSLPKAGAQG